MNEGSALPSLTAAPAASARTRNASNEGSSAPAPALHESQGEAWLRTLTVKLRGRPEALIKRRRRILSSGAGGADMQACHGPLQRLLEGLPPRIEGTKVAWHSLTARMRATPTWNKARRSLKLPAQIAPAAAAAQRRRPPRLITTVSRAPKVALRVLRRSYGAKQPRKRRDLWQRCSWAGVLFN